MSPVFRLNPRRANGVKKNTPAAEAQKKCATNDPEPHTIEWLATDYIKHLLHHLHQVLNLEPVAYP